MKNLSLLFAFLMLLTWQAAHAQNLIAVQNGNTPAFYTVLDSAIIHAQNGDTVYIPGGTFPLTVQVTKSIHIIGVGHNPDSTLAIDFTRIGGNLSLIDDASDGSLYGVNLEGKIISVSEPISNYLVQRSIINAGLRVPTSSNWSFIENIINGVFDNQESPGPSNFFFSNNVVGAGVGNFWGVYGFTSSDFRNNIFLYQAGGAWGDYWWPINATGSSFENNIFISTINTLRGIRNSSIYNNLFVESISFPPNGGYWSSDNIVGQAQSSIFVNQTGNGFSYAHDYQLQATCPGKNAGKDGTDLGIFGGAYPWKIGSLPPNPHVQYRTVSDVHPDGNIKVVIKVSAQDR